MYIKAKWTILVLIIVLLMAAGGYLMSIILPSQAEAQPYCWYKTGANDQWTTLAGNWWLDCTHTDQAPALPNINQGDIGTQLSGSISPQINTNTWQQVAAIETNGLVPVFNGSGGVATSIVGDAVFNDSSYCDNCSVSGTATFNGTSYSRNPMTGTAGSVAFQNSVTFTITAIWSANTSAWSFSGTPIWIFNTGGSNEGTLSGNATFNGTSYNAANAGTVNGNATFVGDNSENGSSGQFGTVTGTKTRKYTSAISTTRNFITDGPWTIVADGAVVNLVHATYNNATTLSAINGGSFVLTDTVAAAPVAESNPPKNYGGGTGYTSLSALYQQLYSNGVPPGGAGPEASSSEPTVFERDLRYGMEGEDVRSLQTYLNTYGFTVAHEGEGSRGLETMYFGNATTRAVIQMQKAYFIEPAAGYVGQATRKILNKKVF
jgi:hypothetical protein